AAPSMAPPAALAGGGRRRRRDRAAVGAGIVLAHPAGRQQLDDLPADGAPPVAGAAGCRLAHPAARRARVARARRRGGWPARRAVGRQPLRFPLLRRLAAVRRDLVHAGGAADGGDRRAARPPPAALVALPRSVLKPRL